MDAEGWMLDTTPSSDMVKPGFGTGDGMVLIGLSAIEELFILSVDFSSIIPGTAGREQGHWGN